MFNKLKSRKAPLSLSSVSNAIKSAGSTDLSPTDISQKHLDIATINQLGVPKNSVLAAAFDPVQSLLAVATTGNEIRVFGQQHVEVVFEFNSSKPINYLKFVKGVYLVGISSGSGDITVLSLHSKQILDTHLFPGAITSVCVDPSLDWLVVGLANGSVMFYDVDRLQVTPFRIDNLQKRVLPKQKLSPVLNLEWHPRDIGSILITYSHSACIFSLASGQVTSTFIYEIGKDAKGFEYSNFVASGYKKKMFGGSKSVISEMVEAHFHPNGLHLVTLHTDNSIVFWDSSTSTLLESRSVFETGLHKPGQAPASVPTEISSVRWVCARDPEFTQLVISGGDGVPILHVLDFGFTLKYSMASYDKQGDFYSQPQGGQRIIPLTFYDSDVKSTDPKHPIEPERIRDIIPLASDSLPYFNGCHDPNYLLLVTNHNSIYFIQFSAGAQGSTDLGNLILPVSIGFIHPPVVYSYVQLVRRVDWYSILSSRASGGATAKTKYLLSGGAATSHHNEAKPLGHNDSFRTILVTGHLGGLVRLIDISRSETLENENIVQISLKETLYDDGNPDALRIAFVSTAFETREMLIALANGDVVICKYGKRGAQDRGNASSKDYKDSPKQHTNGNASILDISNRILGSFSLSHTFLPVSLLQTTGDEKVSCLKLSEIGFAAIGYTSGRLIVCDITRGPAIILNTESINEYLVSAKGLCHVTTIEFSIMEYDQDGYSSIILLVGTNTGGNLITFKIIPQPNGAFQAVMVSKTMGLNYRSLSSDDQTNSKLDQILPISAKDGLSTVATLEVFKKLSQGVLIRGYVITTSQRDLRVLKLPKQKLSHKVIEDVCARSGVVLMPGGAVLAVLVKSGFVKLLSLPALTDIADVKMPKEIYNSTKDALASGAAFNSNILSTGTIFARVGDTQLYNLSVYNTKLAPKSSRGASVDLLFNENAVIPPRPAASALLWAKGQTLLVATSDLTFLIAGPNRKPPKNEESTLAHNISPEANPQQGYGGYLSGGSAPAANDRGYKDPVRKGAQTSGYGGYAPGFMRNIQLGIESIEEGFNEYANGASEAMTSTVESLKKSMYSAAFKSKMGL